MKQIQDLAREMYNQFETKQRDNGEDFVSLKEGSPDWMQELCQEAHNGMLPDDLKYRFILEALQAVIEHEDDEDAGWRSIESDIYTNDLLAWLSSDLRRVQYVDDAVSQGLTDGTNLIDSMGAGQQNEKQEVFSEVFSGLTRQLDELEQSA